MAHLSTLWKEKSTRTVLNNNVCHIRRLSNLTSDPRYIYNGHVIAFAEVVEKRIRISIRGEIQTRTLAGEQSGMRCFDTQ